MMSGVPGLQCRIEAPIVAESVGIRATWRSFKAANDDSKGTMFTSKI